MAIITGREKFDASAGDGTADSRTPLRRGTERRVGSGTEIAPAELSDEDELTELYLGIG